LNRRSLCSGFEAAAGNAGLARKVRTVAIFETLHTGVHEAFPPVGVDGAIRLLVAGDTQVDVASAEQVLAVASAVLAPFAQLPAASSEGMASLTIGAVAVDSALNAELELRIALISVGAVCAPFARHAKRG